MTEIPYGYCHCGCGGKTTIAHRDDAWNGRVKGQPMRFILRHHGSVTSKPRRTGVGPDDWTVEDRGFETPCWIWKGQTRNSGHADYRRVGIDGHYETAHAAVYRRMVGPIPDGHELHHRCEQQPCVRPDHLQPLRRADHLRLHKRKLSDEQVRAIRQDRRPLAQIAASYGIGYTYASNVRTGVARSYVEA